MYFIYGQHKGSTSKYTIYDPRDSTYSLISASLSLECGTAGSLTLEIPYDNASRDVIVCPSDEIYVERISTQEGETEIWRGRPITDEVDFQLTRKITCEGILAWLYDSFYPPFSFSGQPATLLSMIVDAHNTSVGSDKSLSMGDITVSEAISDTISLSSTEYDRSLNVIIDNLVNKYGGYLTVTVDKSSGTKNLNWLASYGTTASQSVELGVNILDVATSIEYGDMITAVLPLGAKDSKTGKYLTIASVYQSKVVLQDDDLVSQYGFICDTVHWDNVTSATTLLEKASEYLETTYDPVKSVEVKAVDLGYTSTAIDYINLGDTVTVKSTPHGVDTTMTAVSMDIDLIDPSNDSITFGKTMSGITDRTASTTRQVVSDISELQTATNAISANLGDTTTITISSQKMASGTTWRDISCDDVNLSAGTYIVSLSIVFGANATGRRGARIAGGTSGGAIGPSHAVYAGTSDGNLVVQSCTTISPTYDNYSLKPQFYQNSGSTLAISGYMRITRLI